MYPSIENNAQTYPHTLRESSERTQNLVPYATVDVNKLETRRNQFGKRNKTSFKLD